MNASQGKDQSLMLSKGYSLSSQKEDFIKEHSKQKQMLSQTTPYTPKRQANNVGIYESLTMLKPATSPLNETKDSKQSIDKNSTYYQLSMLSSSPLNT